MATAITAAKVKAHLVGLQGWLNVAASSPAGDNGANYDDAYITNTVVPRVIRLWERNTRFRVNRVQVASRSDGTYAPAVNDGTSGSMGAFGGTFGPVVQVAITAGGTGYTSVPTVTFGAPPAGGTQATGVATVFNGAVSGVVLTNPGAGYTSAPVVSFSGGGGSGAAATAKLLPFMVEKPYNYWADEFPAYGNIILNEKPVLYVQRMRLLFSNTAQVFPVPSSWLQWDPRSGQVSIVPVAASNVVVTSSAIAGLSILTAGFGVLGYVPNFVSVDYIAGLDDNWQNDPQWDDLQQSLEERVALQVLEDIAQAYYAGTMSASIAAAGYSQQFQFDRFMTRKQELQAKLTQFQQDLAETEGGISLGSM